MWPAQPNNWTCRSMMHICSEGAQENRQFSDLEKTKGERKKSLEMMDLFHA